MTPTKLGFLERLGWGALYAVVTFIVVLIVLAIVSALLPGVVIDARFWAGILAVIVFLITLVSGRRFF